MAALLMTGGLVVAALVVVAVVASLSNGGGQASSNRAPAPKRQAAATTTTIGTTTSTTTRAEAIAELLSDVRVSPPDGSRKQPLSTVVTVRAAGAQLGSVHVTKSPDDAALAGAFDQQTGVWRSSGALLPATSYTVWYSVSGAGGLEAKGSSTFETAPPAEVVTANVFPTAGISVGIGQPIVVTFSHPIDTYAAQQAVLSRFTVAMSKPVPGGWHWFSSVELHFRPSHYWPVGEQVRLSGNLDYWDIGGGAWGEGQVSTGFVVGDSHISTVNLAAHRMVVTDNGQVIYDWPVSAGRAQYPSMDGTHIVLDRESVVRMDSATVGIPVHSPNGYNELVYWDVHIADSGEYVHAAPWDIDVQGTENVSHGCINLSPARAETFFRFSRAGDIVNIVDGPRPPVMGDHGVIDWSFGSAVTWTPAKVAKLTAAVTVLPTTSVPPPSGVPYYGPTLPPASTTVPLTTAPATTVAPTTATPTTPTTPTTATTAPATTAPVTTATTAPATTAPVTTALAYVAPAGALPATTAAPPTTNTVPTAPAAVLPKLTSAVTTPAAVLPKPTSAVTTPGATFPKPTSTVATPAATVTAPTAAGSPAT